MGTISNLRFLDDPQKYGFDCNTFGVAEETAASIGASNDAIDESTRDLVDDLLGRFGFAQAFQQLIRPQDM